MELFDVRTFFSNRIEFFGVSRKTVEKFIYDQAAQFNYNMYRYWKEDEKEFYDCGPVTYIVTPHK